MKLAFYIILLIIAMLKLVDIANFGIIVTGFNFEDIIYLSIFIAIVIFLCTFWLWDKKSRKSIFICILVYCSFNVFMVLNNFGIICIRKLRPEGQRECFDIIAKIRNTLVRANLKSEIPQDGKLDLNKIIEIGAREKEKELKYLNDPNRSDEQKQYDLIFANSFLDSEPETIKKYGCKYDVMGDISDISDYKTVVFCYKHFTDDMYTKKFLNYSDEYLRRYPNEFFSGRFNSDTLINTKRKINSYSKNTNLEKMTFEELLHHYREPLRPIMMAFFPFYLHPLRK